jgi:hypothetical protein
MLDFTLRRDESLKFPKNNRVGWFPGISLGWRLSEEPFIKNNYGFIDNLKFRASYGQMGSDNVGDYQYMETALYKSRLTATFWEIPLRSFHARFYRHAQSKYYLGSSQFIQCRVRRVAMEWFTGI